MARLVLGKGGWWPRKAGSECWAPQVHWLIFRGSALTLSSERCKAYAHDAKCHVVSINVEPTWINTYWKCCSTLFCSYPLWWQIPRYISLDIMHRNNQSSFYSCINLNSPFHSQSTYSMRLLRGSLPHLEAYCKIYIYHTRRPRLVEIHSLRGDRGWDFVLGFLARGKQSTFMDDVACIERLFYSACRYPSSTNQLIYLSSVEVSPRIRLFQPRMLLQTVSLLEALVAAFIHREEGLKCMYCSCDALFPHGPCQRHPSFSSHTRLWVGCIGDLSCSA